LRYGILSDVHGNLEAFEAVLAHFSRLAIDRYVCLGDVVGYGADPVACLEILRDRSIPCVVGNHDAAAVNNISIELFNSYAISALRWTQAQLRPEDCRYLSALPFVIREERVCFAHAALHRPDWFEYLRTPQDALESFRAQDSKVAFIGHSHVPIAYLLSGKRLVVTFDTLLSLARSDSRGTRTRARAAPSMTRRRRSTKCIAFRTTSTARPKKSFERGSRRCSRSDCAQASEPVASPLDRVVGFGLERRDLSSGGSSSGHHIGPR
jgi:predicted phosphodiesterase